MIPKVVNTKNIGPDKIEIYGMDLERTVYRIGRIENEFASKNRNRVDIATSPRGDERL